MRHWRNCSETGWSAYGLFRAHRCHLELNWSARSASVDRVLKIAVLIACGGRKHPFTPRSIIYIYISVYIRWHHTVICLSFGDNVVTLSGSAFFFFFSKPLSPPPPPPFFFFLSFWNTFYYCPLPPPFFSFFSSSCSTSVICPWSRNQKFSSEVGSIFVVAWNHIQLLRYIKRLVSVLCIQASTLGLFSIEENIKRRQHSPWCMALHVQ